MDLQPDDRLLRRMRDGNVKRDGSIKKQAFMPSASGKDRNGLSVSVRSPEHAHLHRSIYEGDGFRTAVVLVGTVRKIVIDSTALDAVLDPTKVDPMHALITAIPDRTIGEREKLIAERCAELLALASREYDHKLFREVSDLPT